VTAAPHSTCPCCGSRDLFEIGKLQDSFWFAGTRLETPLRGGWLYRCRNCQLKFRNPAESDHAYRDLYDNEATTTWEADASRPDWELVTRYVSQTQARGAKVLDFGCYTGGLLEKLGPQFQRYGIEINRVAAATASELIGQSVWSSVDEIPPGLRFDAVIATDVIEHVTNPLLLIEQLSSSLSDDGLLIITTGDADNYLWNRFGANWWYCFYPDHISFVSRSWLDYVSDVAAVSVVDCESFRYHNSGVVRRFLDRVFVYWYGWFPSTYLRFGRLLSKLRGRPALTSLPGVGVSRDHLFVVLKRAAKL